LVSGVTIDERVEAIEPRPELGISSHPARERALISYSASSSSGSRRGRRSIARIQQLLLDAEVRAEHIR